MNEIEKDLQDYYKLMLANNTYGCTLIEKKYDLYGASPAMVTTELEELARKIDAKESKTVKHLCIKMTPAQVEQLRPLEAALDEHAYTGVATLGQVFFYADGSAELHVGLLASETAERVMQITHGADANFIYLQADLESRPWPMKNWLDLTTFLTMRRVMIFVLRSAKSACCNGKYRKRKMA